MTERQAGESKASSDGVDELLDEADAPEGPEIEPTVEIVESGPAQPMPGSASNREVKSPPPEPVSARSDLRKLAPKKKPDGPRRDLGKYDIRGGNSALDTVLQRGIDSGDVSSIDPVEAFRVTKGGRAMVGGRLCEVKTNARVTRLTHDLQSLRLQGIEFELVGRK